MKATAVIQLPIGAHKLQLDTPVYCVDLDALQANIDAMAGFIAARGKDWRPHAKCHKVPAIAHAQLRAGAIGVTCAKVSEAEVLAAAGIRDILIANMVVGQAKVERVAALCRHAEPIVACDHFAQLDPLAGACRDRGVSCRVVLEVDIGMERVGVRPGRDALELAQGAAELEGIELVGLMGYEGHLLRIPDADEKRRRIEEAIAVLVHCRDRLSAAGLRCDIVSAGGTGSYQITADCPGVTELQCGGGVFGDAYYREQCGVRGLSPALTVLATVVSRPTLDRAALDVGRKTIHPDIHPPAVKGHPDAEVLGLSAEHCRLRLGPGSRDLRIGDKVELFVGYADFTTVLHDALCGFRGERLEVVWPILGRGKLE
ncbi:MAG: DSD1 family PLP-dependent enzyme [Planctomycetales bacterium]